MELHLIGEEVPAAELTADALAGGDVNVVGYPADESVGAEGGRRRQLRREHGGSAEAAKPGKNGKNGAKAGQRVKSEIDVALATARSAVVSYQQVCAHMATESLMSQIYHCILSSCRRRATFPLTHIPF